MRLLIGFEGKILGFIPVRVTPVDIAVEPKNRLATAYIVRLIEEGKTVSAGVLSGRLFAQLV